MDLVTDMTSSGAAELLWSVVRPTVDKDFGTLHTVDEAKDTKLETFSNGTLTETPIKTSFDSTAVLLHMR